MQEILDLGFMILDLVVAAEFFLQSKISNLKSKIMSSDDA